MISEKNSIVDEIKETIEKIFSVRVTEYVEINKGLLNLKWKFVTDNRTLFVKQYNSERYPASKERRLNKALLFQKKLNEKNIRCPQILSYEGEMIFRTKHDIRFGVTEYCEGTLINAGKINLSQFHDLGIELAKLHRVINDLINEKATPTWVVPSKEQLITNWKKNYLLANDKDIEDISDLLKLQRKIFEDMDMDIFKGCRHGWAHSDLWCDNVLFHPDSLSAIVDFDRLQYIYPELDISRAILSFALDNDYLRIDAVKSFIDGYNQIGNISIEDTIRSLKLLYCLESFWWLRSDILNSEGPPKRFAEEMAWLSVNWMNLDKILTEN